MKRAALICIAVVCFGCTRAPSTGEVRIGAAASLRDLLFPGCAGFCSANMGTKLGMSFGASSELSRQVEAGAPFDLILSADAANVDRLGAKIVAGTRRVFLTNRLALVAPPGSAGLADIRDGTTVAIAGPEVPAGKAWRKYLDSSRALGDRKPRFVLGDDVTATLAAFESGAADFALVYQTDAGAAKREHSTHVPADGHVVEYVAAIVAGHETAESRAFLDWLGSKNFQEEARSRGFGIPAR